MPTRLIQQAYKLCCIPSVTGDEADVVNFLCTSLQHMGFTVEKLPVDKERFNLFAYFTKKPRYTAIFCTHVDTVAPFIEPRIDENKKILWGRGACDAKGIVATMIETLLAQHALGFDDVALLLTVGEEESSDGAKTCNLALRGRARFLVVGEPTELKAAYAQKGSLVFDLIAHGKEAHSSMPHLGDSAIHKLVGDIQKLLSYPWPTHKRFKETLLNIGHIDGGFVRNVVAPSAQAQAIMRTAQKSSDLLDIITKALSDGVVLKVHSSSDPFDYMVPDGFDSFLAGFGSDAPHLSALGKPILIGPGSLSLAHKPDEHISFTDLLDGVASYQKIAASLRAREDE
jgi:acetylornithine deacetylase